MSKWPAGRTVSLIMFKNLKPDFHSHILPDASEISSSKNRETRRTHIFSPDQWMSYLLVIYPIRCYLSWGALRGNNDVLTFFAGENFVSDERNAWVEIRLQGHFPLGWIFRAERHFLCLKIDWRRVEAKRQKKISSAWWKTALMCSLFSTFHWRNFVVAKRKSVGGNRTEDLLCDQNWSSKEDEYHTKLLCPLLHSRANC